MSIISLQDIQSKGCPIEEVGNKAFYMSVIKNAGLRTSDGFVIPVSTFCETLKYNHADEQYDNCTVENDFVKLREMIKTFAIHEDIWQEILFCVGVIGFPVIVRSSSPLEDGYESSMAGMYLSIGNVCDEAALADAIREVWASAFYNKTTEHKPLAILIQHYYSADIGGVIFSQNPFGGNLYYGEYAENSTEKAVNGEENIAFELGEDGIIGNVTEKLRAESNVLYNAINRLKDKLGGEVDVEWLLDKEGICFLQVRPITGIKRRKKINYFAIVNSEDEEALEEIDMSGFYSRYMKWYDKRMRLRLMCKKHEVHLPIVKYVFYSGDNLDIDAVFKEFDGVDIFKIESDIGIRTVKKEKLETFLYELFESLHKEHLIVRIQEITLTEACGNSCMLENGTIYVECMPGGFGGFLKGELDFSRYILDKEYNIIQKDIFEYDKVWKFSEETGRFEKTLLNESVSGELSTKQLYEIVDMTKKLNTEVRNIKIEFEIAGEHAYFNDATLEDEFFGIEDVKRRVISPGDFEGKLCIMSVDELLSMKAQLGGRSVIAESTFLIKQKEYIDEMKINESAGDKILVAPYPEPCLSALIPHYNGFIFSKGGALSHLAIILREQHNPAIIERDIYNWGDGTFVSIKNGVIYNMSKEGREDE